MTAQDNRRRLTMYRGQAISVLKQHPNAEVVVAMRDGTRHFWIDRLVTLDDGGELVMTHPTDPGAPPVRAPESGHYRVLSEGPDWAALCKEKG